MLGVAVLASIFTGAGGYGSPQMFVNGLVPALWVGVAMLSAGALAVLVLPFKTTDTSTLEAQLAASERTSAHSVRVAGASAELGQVAVASGEL